MRCGAAYNSCRSPCRRKRHWCASLGTADEVEDLLSLVAVAGSRVPAGLRLDRVPSAHEGTNRTQSRQRVEFLVAQVSRHDGDRDWERARRLANIADERVRSFDIDAGAKHEGGDVNVLVDEVEDLLSLVAVADHALRRDAGRAVGARGKAVEDGVRRLPGFRLHVIGNPEPLLMAAARLDHQQHDHGGAGARRAAAPVIDGAVAFRRFVDNDEIFRLVPGFVAAALAAHRPSPGIPPDYKENTYPLEFFGGHRAPNAIVPLPRDHGRAEAKRPATLRATLA